MVSVLDRATTATPGNGRIGAKGLPKTTGTQRVCLKVIDDQKCNPTRYQADLSPQRPPASAASRLSGLPR